MAEEKKPKTTAPDQPEKLPELDRLTGQLYYLPFIIGRMGINIAEAQTALNADYVNTLTKIMDLMKAATDKMQAKDEASASTGGESAPGAPEAAKADTGEPAKAPGPDLALLQSILEEIAPSRYQFTEATIDFSADLAESVDSALSGGLGFGLGGFVVNAGYAKSYAHDYRAAARITATLHAIPADKESRTSLLARSKEISATPQKLVATTATEKVLWDAVNAHVQQRGAESIGSASGEEAKATK